MSEPFQFKFGQFGIIPSDQIKPGEIKITTDGKLSEWTTKLIQTPKLKVPSPGDGEMLRYNTGKPRLGLVPGRFAALLYGRNHFKLLEETAKVLTFGATKYTPNNWRKAGSWEAVVSSMLRHLLAIKNGELLDKESNLSHIGHIGCNLAFLLEFVTLKLGTNDFVETGTDYVISSLQLLPADDPLTLFMGSIISFQNTGGDETELRAAIGYIGDYANEHA